MGPPFVFRILLFSAISSCFLVSANSRLLVHTFIEEGALEKPCDLFPTPNLVLPARQFSEPISNACSMMAAAVLGIIEPNHTVKFESCIIAHGCKAGEILLMVLRIKKLFWPRINDKLSVPVGSGDNLAVLVGDDWSLQDRDVERFVGDKVKLCWHQQYVRGFVSNIPKPDSKFSSQHHFLFHVACKRLDELWGPSKYDPRSVLSLEIPFGLQISPDSCTQIAEGASSKEGTDEYLNFSDWAGGSPTSTIGFLLIVLGFLGSVGGFVWLFGLLIWNIRSWRQTFGSIGCIILSIVIFHVGLFCLLK